MRHEDLTELHYITAIENIRSIIERDVLSHRRAARVEHVSVAMQEIQERRRAKRVPGGRPLHEYVNLYVCARNPMLYKRKEDHQSLCVLRVAPQVLEVQGTVVVDRNASSYYARFAPAPAGLTLLNGDIIFAEYWTHAEDQIEASRRKSMKCAEVLVPDRVDPGLTWGPMYRVARARQFSKRGPLASP